MHVLLPTPPVATDVLWVGLNDQRNQMLFEWSDRSPVSFTYWQSGEPSHANNLQEDCVLIRGKVTPAAVQQKWSQISSGSCTNKPSG